MLYILRDTVQAIIRMKKTVHNTRTRIKNTILNCRFYYSHIFPEEQAYLNIPPHTDKSYLPL